MFLLAAVDSGAYKALLFLHIVAVVVAFSPSVVHALVGPILLRDDDASGRRFAGVAAAQQRAVHLPALLVAGILGFALVGSSGEVWKFSDPWVSVSALLWLVIGGITGALILPGQKLVAEGDRGAEAKVRMGYGIVSLLFIVVVFLMVVKPG